MDVSIEGARKSKKLALRDWAYVGKWDLVVAYVQGE